MTKFIRFAVAAATAATVALAPMSVAHASSFGSSSSNGGAVVEQPGKLTDQEFSDRFRDVLRDEMLEAGFPENDAATASAEDVIAEALAGEFVYHQSEHGFSAAESWRSGDGASYYNLILRVSKSLAATADFSQVGSIGTQPLAFPFGIAAAYDDNYHYVVVSLKVF